MPVASSPAPDFRLETYSPPGPVAAAFIADRASVGIIEGPYGSGKTTACFFKLLRRAARMPISKGGVILYKAVVVRDTYRRMDKTAIRTWLKWYGKEMGTWAGGQDRPSSHNLKYTVKRRLSDGLVHDVPVDFSLEFAAVGDQDVEDFMDGFEVTDFFLNAINLLSEDVLTYAVGRTGRFPAEKDLPDGAVYDRGVFGDCNAPETDSWLDKYTNDLPKGAAYFRQPGGRDPGAENIANLRAGYYREICELNKNKPWWIARLIDNKRGFSRSGKPVYQEFNDSIHVAKTELQLVDDAPVRLGFDAGKNPALVAAQWMPDGQFRVFDSFFMPGRGPTLFAEEVAAWLARWGISLDRIDAAATDPSAFWGGDKEGGDLAWTETVDNITGLTLTPAPSNELHPRLDAVRQQLTYMIDGHKPAFLLSPRCAHLRQGFNSGYRYSKRRMCAVEPDETMDFGEKPDKNDASHEQDAVQYLILDALGLDAVTRASRRMPDRQGAPRRGAPRPASRIKVRFNAFGH